MAAIGVFIVGAYIMTQVLGFMIGSTTDIYSEWSARWWMNTAKNEKLRYKILMPVHVFTWWYKGYRYLKRRGLNA